MCIDRNVRESLNLLNPLAPSSVQKVPPSSMFIGSPKNQLALQQRLDAILLTQELTLKQVSNSTTLLESHDATLATIQRQLQARHFQLSETQKTLEELVVH